MAGRIVREKILDKEGFGRIKLQWRRGTRTLRLSIRPFEGINLSIPNYLSQGEAEKWLETKTGWLKKNLVKNASKEEQKTVFHPGTFFRTRDHRLQVLTGSFASLSTRVSHGLIQVKVPRALPMFDRTVQEKIREAVLRALKKEALAHLPERTLELARQHGFSVRKIQLRNNLSRWGSCSSRGNISLNIHLMRLPQHLIDYVILHELVHTVHPHHQHPFWDLLDRLTGGAKVLERELKNYHTQIF